MGFRENLKAELEYQGILVKELAEKSGISKKTIDHYLISNPREPLVSNAVAIAKALNVSVEYLVTGNLKKKNSESSLPTDFQNYTEKMSKLTPSKRKIIFELIDSLIEEK